MRLLDIQSEASVADANLAEEKIRIVIGAIPDLTSRGRFQNLEHETGLEPATPALAISSRWYPWRPVFVQSSFMASIYAQSIVSV